MLNRMWAVLVVIGVVLAFGSAVADETSKDAAKPTSEHKSHDHHGKHKHAKNCGHKAEKHGDHVDYEDDGHHHKKHGNHYDECDGPEGDAKAADPK